MQNFNEGSPNPWFKMLPRIFISGSVILALALPIFAGNLSGQGIKLGFNAADQTGSDHFFLATIEPGGEKKPRLGFCLGGFITYQLTDWLALQPELLLSVKGAKFTEEGSDLIATAAYDSIITWDNQETWKLTYIEIPLLMKFTVPTSSNIKPNIIMGPAVGIKVGSKLDWHWSGSGKPVGAIYNFYWDESSKENIDGLENIELSFVFGTGIDFELTSGKILFDVRYTMGLTKSDSYKVDFKKVEWGHVERSNLDIKNRTISIMLGYSF